MQVLSLKIFGVTDLALRIPTSISAVLTCIFLFWFFTRKIKQPWLGVLTATVLITTPGYVSLHGIRTADYDATLTLFTTLYAVYFYLFLEEGNRNYFWATVAFVICAALTKGIQGVLFLPALLIYAIYKKKGCLLLKMSRLYAGVALFLFFVFGYYHLREHYNPGYINAVMDNEIGGRYANTIEGHYGDDLYYYHYLINIGFKPWYLLYLPGLIFGQLSTDRAIKNITVFASISTLFFGSVLSLAGTKLEWYTLPMFPLLAIPVAIFIHMIARLLYESNSWKRYLTHNIFPYFFMLLVCIIPFSDMFNYAMTAHGVNTEENDAGIILKKITKDGYPYDTKMHVIVEEYQGGLDWYLKVFTLRNMPVVRAQKGDIPNGEFVPAYNSAARTSIEETYIAEVVASVHDAKIYRIKDRKNIDRN